MLHWISKHAVAVNLSVVLGLMAALALGSMWTSAWGADQAAAGTEAAAAGAQASPPITWQEAVKMFAAAVAISLTALATAITQCRIGSAGVGALAENPKLFGSILVYLVIPETMVILGFVIAALIVF